MTGGGGTTGLRTTLGLMKSGFTFATIIVVILAAADVYKMYDDGITINLEAVSYTHLRAHEPLR